MYLNQIYRLATKQPDRLAVINSGREITFGEFARVIAAVREYLLQSALPSAGVKVNISGNLYNDWVLLLALRSLGHTTVSGNSWKTVESIGIADIGALVCFADQTKAMESFAAARPDRPIVEIPRSLDAADQRLRLLPEDVPFGDHIAYTSGTTGNYKKLCFKGELVEPYIIHDSHGLTGQGLTEDDMFFAYNFGPWTAIGYKQVMRCWYRGASVVFDQRPDWFNHFFDHPITMTSFVPGLLDQVCQTSDRRPAGYPMLRVQVGGGFVDARKARALAERLDCEVHAAYGGTEFRSALTQLVEKDEDVIWMTPNFDPGIEIVDDDDRPVGPGIEGVLRIRCSPNDPTEYLDDPDATAKYFRHGHFYPGDMAIRRADGRIRILGRVADVLNVGGHKVAVEPVEQRLRDFLQVPSLCAFVQQDDRGREILVVAIEGDNLPDGERLQGAANRLGQFPAIRFLTIPNFPRGANGMMKVNRREVLRLVRERPGQEASRIAVASPAAPLPGARGGARNAPSPDRELPRR